VLSIDQLGPLGYSDGHLNGWPCRALKNIVSVLPRSALAVPKWRCCRIVVTLIHTA
jgi:hypothetical protein